MEVWQKTSGSSTSHMFSCSQRDISSFRKLTAQSDRRRCPYRGSLPTVKRWRVLNICTYIPNHIFSSHKIHFGWALYAESWVPICSVLKKAPELSLPSGTGGVTKAPVIAGIALLRGTSLVPQGSQFVCCLRRCTALAGTQPSQILWSLLPCHLTVYCSVIYQQHLTGLGPKHEKADCKMNTEREKTISQSGPGRTKFPLS